MVFAQKTGESYGEPGSQIVGSIAVQSQNRPKLSSEGRLPVLLGLCFSSLGWCVSGSLVPSGKKIPYHTDEESGSNASGS